MLNFRKFAVENKIMKILTAVLFALLPAFYAFMLEWFNRQSLVLAFAFFNENARIARFSFVLVYIVFAAVFLCSKKMWITALIASVLTALSSLTNYYLLVISGENFKPQDIGQVGQTGQLFTFVNFLPPAKGILLIFVSFMLVLFFWFVKGKLPVKIYYTLPVGITVFIILFIFFKNTAVNETILNNYGMSFLSTMDQKKNYESNGFIGAFSINLASGAIRKPEGYSKKSLNDFIDSYETILPEDNFIQPDIIIVLSEAFWDPRLMPMSEFSEDPLENFDRIKYNDNSYSGSLVVPAYGGATIRTEFEVLTGLSIDAFSSVTLPYNYIKGNMPTYISYYKSLGYDTLAIHPNTEKFYSRHKGLPKLGFDEFVGSEGLLELEISAAWAGPNITDATLLKYIKHYMQNDAPKLLFAITMEGHFPYLDKYKEFSITTENPLLGKEDLVDFKHYVQGVKNADNFLGGLYDFIAERNRPTVLLFFGDHLPSLGTNYSSYESSGFIDGERGSDREKLFSTPFLLCANFDINSGMFESKTENKISPYNLLNALSSSIGGGKTHYMSFMEELYKNVPYYNYRLLKEITEKQKFYINKQIQMTYQLVTGK